MASFHLMERKSSQNAGTDPLPAADPGVPAGKSRGKPAASPRRPARQSDNQIGLAATSLRALLHREPLIVPASMPIREAAALMRAEHVSSLLIGKNGQIEAIITDRDFRNRVIADGVPTDRPVIDVATRAPQTLDIHATAFDALLLLARRGVHHGPVIEGGKPAGMLTTTDLTEHHASSAAFLAQEIDGQEDVTGLQRVCSRLRSLQANLVAADASAQATGRLITAITDALTSRLIVLAQDRLGPAPVPYAWVAAGSQARAEQTARSDQDNCLILDDSYRPAQHGEYFQQFAQFVCAGLDACGYVFCPGDMMAQTDTWRQPLATWKRYFHEWIAAPEPMALMLTCVFFDLRFVHGESALVETLRHDFLERSRGNGIFLAHMVGNALKHRPALNLFGRLSPARSGEHRGRIDLKHQGIVPIVDLARVYALAGGHPAVNTYERLEIAAQGGEVSGQSARDLRDALEFLAITRIRHQARMIEDGSLPDNHLAPSELSNFERTQLCDAFAVVQTLQSVLGQRYQ
jgi:CBS domain-containing protein